VFFLTRNSRNGNFNPTEVLKDIQGAITKSIKAKSKASEEWNKVKLFRKEQEDEIKAERDNLKHEQSAMKEIFDRLDEEKGDLSKKLSRHKLDLEEMQRKRNEVEETEKAFEVEVQRLQSWEHKLRDEQRSAKEQREDFKRKTDMINQKELANKEFERQLRKKKNEYDMLHIKLQTKERNLKDLESELSLNMRKLQSERKAWDNEQKQIYFDQMFAEKREILIRDKRNQDREKAEIARLKSEQEMLSAELQDQLHNLENEQKQLGNMKLELKDELVSMDRKRNETNKLEQEINQRRKDMEVAMNLQQEKEKELKMQQDQIQNEYGKLQTWFEKKVRKELAGEKAEVDKQKTNVKNEFTTLKRSQLQLKREEMALKKKQSEDEQELERAKTDMQNEKDEIDIIRANLEMDKADIDKRKLFIKAKQADVNKAAQQLEIDRSEMRETVEKEILEKYKTMMSYAEKYSQDLAQEREEFAAERKKFRQEKKELEEQRENLEEEIQQRVKAKVAVRENDLALSEEKLKDDNNQLLLEKDRVTKESHAAEESLREARRLKVESEEAMVDANGKLTKAEECAKAAEEQKRKNGEEKKRMEVEREELQERIQLHKEIAAKQMFKLGLWEEKLEKKEKQQIGEVELFARKCSKLDVDTQKLDKLSNLVHNDAKRRLKVVTKEKSQIDELRNDLDEAKKNWETTGNELKEDCAALLEKQRMSMKRRPSDELSMDGSSGKTSVRLHHRANSDSLYQQFRYGWRNTNGFDSTAQYSIQGGDSISFLYEPSLQSVEEKNRLKTSLTGSRRLRSKPSSASFDNVYVEAVQTFGRTSIPAPSPRRKNTEIQKWRKPYNFIINMIESGEHKTSIFFFLGVERKMVKTIKAVMMDVSPKLKELVQASDVVELPTLTIEGFESTLKFIYSGDRCWSVDSIVPTLACACVFEIPDLYEACIGWIEANLQPEEAVTVLEDCISHNEALGVETKKKVEKAAWDVIVSDQDPEHNRLCEIFEPRDENWVRNVLKGSSLICNEEALFDALASWACYQVKLNNPDFKNVSPQDWNSVDDATFSPQNISARNEISKILHDLVPLIRFPIMSPEYITTNMLISSLLKPSDILEALRYNLDPGVWTTRFPRKTRYKTREISQQGTCSQSSKYYTVLEEDSFGDITGKPPGQFLSASNAITDPVPESDIARESLDPRNFAQTKYDCQPWWSIQLGRLSRIIKIEVFLGSPIREIEQTDDEEMQNDMFPLAFCLARREFPQMEGTLAEAMEMSVKVKTFETPPEEDIIKLTWEPNLVAARNFRIQCKKATSLRILQVKIFSAEPE